MTERDLFRHSFAVWYDDKVGTESANLRERLNAAVRRNLEDQIH